MRKYYPFFAVGLVSCLLLACTRKTVDDGFPDNQYPPVFHSYTEAGSTLEQVLAQAGNGEQLAGINTIIFLESGNKAYALVYYATNLGQFNILFEKTYQGSTVLTKKTYQCVGTTCDCKVVTSTGGDGQLLIRCTCTDCTLLENNY